MFSSLLALIPPSYIYPSLLWLSPARPAWVVSGPLRLIAYALARFVVDFLSWTFCRGLFVVGLLSWTFCRGCVRWVAWVCALGGRTLGGQGVYGPGPLSCFL